MAQMGKPHLAFFIVEELVETCSADKTNIARWGAGEHVWFVY